MTENSSATHTVTKKKKILLINIFDQLNFPTSLGYFLLKQACRLAILPIKGKTI